MADTDYSSQLPIRSKADGADERVHVKIVDGTTSPAVNQVKVDSDNALKVLDTGHDPSGTSHPLRVSEQGALTPDGVYNASTNTKPGNTGLIASSRSATPGDATQTQRLSSVTDTDSGGTVHSLDVSLHDASGNAYNANNPVPVTVVDPPLNQTDVFSSQDALNVPAGSSGNMDYAVTSSKTMQLAKVMCSASGRTRFELQKSVDGTTFTRVMVKYNSTANPNVDFDMGLLTLKLTGAGAKFRVVALNEDNQAFDAHALFIGAEK